MRRSRTEGTHASCGILPQAEQSGAHRPTTAKVDLSALAHNYREAVRCAPEKRILAVVKAQAYGHGAVPVSRHLLSLGASMLGVALVEEGQELREAGIDAPILLMGALFPEQAQEIVRWNMVPVVYTPAMAKALERAAGAQGRPIEIHVKIDTGMGRLGLIPEEAPGFIADLMGMRGLRVSGIMTHFADADLQDKSFAAAQVDRFRSVAQALQDRGIPVPLFHAANSAAVLDLETAHFSMVRPGLMLYGYNPLQEGRQPFDVRPVLSLQSRIAFLKRTPPGTPISYGRTFVTRRESLIATIPIGYADGYARALSNRGEAIVRGVRVPVAGRVCMDMTMLDVTDVPGVSEGDEVVLIGRMGNERITADDIAARTGTIAYEVLCAISDRVPRFYVT